jgi:hypothetical protein
MSETLHPGVKLPWIYVTQDLDSPGDWWVWVEGVGEVLCHEPQYSPISQYDISRGICFRVWRPMRESVSYLYPKERSIEAVRAAVERHGK